MLACTSAWIPFISVRPAVIRWRSRCANGIIFFYPKYGHRKYQENRYSDRYLNSCQGYAAPNRGCEAWLGAPAYD